MGLYSACILVSINYIEVKVYLFILVQKLAEYYRAPMWIYFLDPPRGLGMQGSQSYRRTAFLGQEPKGSM